MSGDPHTYIFDLDERTVDGRVAHTKSRLYRVCDRQRQRQFLYWQVIATTTVDDVELADVVIADFQDGAYLDIPQTDKDRALTRIVRNTSQARHRSINAT